MFWYPFSILPCIIPFKGVPLGNKSSRYVAVYLTSKVLDTPRRGPHTAHNVLVRQNHGAQLFEHIITRRAPFWSQDSRARGPNSGSNLQTMPWPKKPKSHRWKRHPKPIPDRSAFYYQPEVPEAFVALAFPSQLGIILEGVQT
jgi:hypothetical protein